MISVVIPTHFKNATLLAQEVEAYQWLGCLPALFHNSKEWPPSEVVVVAEGGIDTDWDELRTYANETPTPVHILRDEKISSYQNAAMRGIRAADGPLVIVLAPWVIVEDPKWLGKIQTIFMRSAPAGYAEILETDNTQQHPTMVSKGSVVLGCEFFAVHKKFDTESARGPDAVDKFQAFMNRIGAKRWVHPGVRNFRAQHSDHETISSQTIT